MHVRAQACLLLVVGCVDLTRPPSVSDCPSDQCLSLDANRAPDAGAPEAALAIEAPRAIDAPPFVPDATTPGAPDTAPGLDLRPPDHPAPTPDVAPQEAPLADAAIQDVAADGVPFVVPTAGLVLWLRADQGIIAVGDRVSAWNDSTGKADSATQSAVAKRPTVVANAVAGHPGVRFDGVSQCLSLPRLVADDFTVMVLFRADAGTSTDTAWWRGAGLFDAEVGGVSGDFGLSLNALGQVLAGTGTPDVHLASTPGRADGAPHLAVFRRVRAAGALSLWVDGEASPGVTGGTASLTTSPRIMLGATQPETNFLRGDIAEVLVWQAALSDGDRGTVEAAFARKYGLRLKGP